MEKAAQKIAENIARSFDYDDEKRQVVAYGLLAMFQTAVTALLIFVVGYMAGVPAEALLICLSVSALRKYSGGAHASSLNVCTAMAVIYSVLAAVAGAKLLAPSADFHILLPVILAVYAVSFILVYMYAPVDSPNKPIKTEKKKKRMRRGSFIVLSVYLTASLALALFGREYGRLNGFVFSLLFGASWQVLTLTKFGFVLVDKADFVLSNLFAVRKEVNH